MSNKKSEDKITKEMAKALIAKGSTLSYFTSTSEAKTSSK